MIITDEELGSAYAESEAVSWRRCDSSKYAYCLTCDTYPNFTKEDLVKDLIEAREQCKVLERNQCAC